METNKIQAQFDHCQCVETNEQRPCTDALPDHKNVPLLVHYSSSIDSFLWFLVFRPLHRDTKPWTRTLISVQAAAVCSSMSWLGFDTVLPRGVRQQQRPRFCDSKRPLCLQPRGLNAKLKWEVPHRTVANIGGPQRPSPAPAPTRKTNISKVHAGKKMPQEGNFRATFNKPGPKNILSMRRKFSNSSVDSPNFQWVEHTCTRPSEVPLLSLINLAVWHLQQKVTPKERTNCVDVHPENKTAYRIPNGTCFLGTINNIWNDSARTIW